MKNVFTCIALVVLVTSGVAKDVHRNAYEGPISRKYKIKAATIGELVNSGKAISGCETTAALEAAIAKTRRKGKYSADVVRSGKSGESQGPNAWDVKMQIVRTRGASPMEDDKALKMLSPKELLPFCRTALTRARTRERELGVPTDKKNCLCRILITVNPVRNWNPHSGEYIMAVSLEFEKDRVPEEVNERRQYITDAFLVSLHESWSKRLCRGVYLRQYYTKLASGKEVLKPQEATMPVGDEWDAAIYEFWVNPTP